MTPLAPDRSRVVTRSPWPKSRVGPSTARNGVSFSFWAKRNSGTYECGGYEPMASGDFMAEEIYPANSSGSRCEVYIWTMVPRQWARRVCGNTRVSGVTWAVQTGDPLPRSGCWCP